MQIDMKQLQVSAEDETNFIRTVISAYAGRDIDAATLEAILSEIDGIRDLVRDAARYQWLRDGNAYAPEEELVTGGHELDALCDEGIREGRSLGYV